MPADLLAPVSQGIDQFINTLSEVTNQIEQLEDSDFAKAKGMLLQAVKDFFGNDNMTNNDIYDFFDDLQTQLAYALAVQDMEGKAYVPQAGRLSWYHDKDDDSKSSSVLRVTMAAGAETVTEAQRVIRNTIVKMFNLEKGSLDSQDRCPFRGRET